jgi:hypothetical protein
VRLFDYLKLTNILVDVLLVVLKAFYMISGVLSYCSDKDIVLESLDLIFTNEVAYKFGSSSLDIQCMFKISMQFKLNS